MARYRATLAYDGTAYQGFQRQLKGVPTIQAAVERAISQVTRQTVQLVGAGRTDTGVHASGQVIAFDVEWKHDDSALLRAINITLPHDIALQDIRQQEGFHPRYDAQSRTYEYSVFQCDQRQPLLIRSTWQMNQHLDFDAMQEAATMLIGQHDFASFGKPPRGENTVRDVFRSEWGQTEQLGGVMLMYTVEATAFLYHMVRRLVGLQVDVGRGRITLDEFERILQAADLSRVKTLAPPQGLVFANVRYHDKIVGNS